VHGSARGLDSWEPVVPYLLDEFELWVYARRGYAPSETPSRPKRFADDVRDVQGVLAAAGGQAHLVGASYGVTVVLHAARSGLVGCLHDLEAMVADEPDVSRWTGIGVPVLLMHGSETWPPMPATMDALAGALAHADRKVLTGHSHFATHTAPALFAESLRTFFQAKS
jgi:pimeloyl-ACP methyl ester carboxylesterase